jgi:DNA-binding IclR family transcriptional regulator
VWNVPDVPAARHTLGVLRMLAQRDRPVGAAALARELGIPRSSLYQLLRVMMDESFIVHYPEERAFGLSGLLTELEAGSLRTDRLRMLAHLVVLAGAEVTYVDRVSAPRAPTTVINIGVRLPAHLTATGRAALAAMPHSQVRALYPNREALYRRAGSGPTTLEQLDAILRDARELGWASEDGEITAGYASVASAVLDRNGRPAAAIGVTFRSGTADAGELGAATSRAAAAIAARLAGR